MKGRLEGKVALVTGGASGLGKAIADRLTTEGVRVVISDVQHELGRSVASEAGFRFFYHDVTDEPRWSELVGQIEGEYGGLHILVNNAGILGPKDACNPENQRYTDWRRVFQVNVDSVFLGCRAAIPAMRRAGAGAIVNISSVAGLLATPYNTAYGASKAAVRQITKSVAQYAAEGGLNIRCNCVHPGEVRTPLRDKSIEEFARTQNLSFDAALQKISATVPMGEFTRAEDVAATVAFLASDDARHITGESIAVDGGIIHCDTFHARRLAMRAT